MKTPSVLAFDRKLDPSDAVFSAGKWEDRAQAGQWTPIAVRAKSVRGTISNRLKTKEQDAAKLDAAIQNANLQTVDVAALPFDADTLCAQFSLRVLAGVGMPVACNDLEYREKLVATVQGYIAEHGLLELGQRYAYNLANGRFLWRNRMGAEAVQVEVAQMQDGRAIQGWTFDALSHTLRKATSEHDDVLALGKLIADALTGEVAQLVLRVTAFVRMGVGLEVFPSQELVLEKTTKSKTLYHVDGVAAIHSQKVGNALRTVDTWYQQVDELGPIAVEPYGSVTTLAKAYRQPKEKEDFYHLLDNWILKGKAPSVEQQHFVMAVLIRGGVFGE